MQKFKHDQSFNGAVGFSTYKHIFPDLDQVYDTFPFEVTQLSLGKSLGYFVGVKTNAARLTLINLPQETTVRTELNREMVSFTLPLNCGEQWKVNGVSGGRCPLFFNTNIDETYIYTKRRHSIVGNVRKKRFLDVLGALLGRERDGVSLPSGVIELTPFQRQNLITKMGTWIPFNQSETKSTALNLCADSLETDIAHLLASAAIRSGYEAPSVVSSSRSCVELVRNAETHFENAGSGTIGLADLCSAANVSAPTLIAAFRDVTGATPMRFFTLKRLARVRNELLSGRASVSAVKQAGLRHGFVQLGRMSALYRSVYGENPSQTVKDP